MRNESARRARLSGARNRCDSVKRGGEGREPDVRARIARREPGPRILRPRESQDIGNRSRARQGAERAEFDMRVAGGMAGPVAARVAAGSAGTVGLGQKARVTYLQRE